MAVTVLTDDDFASTLASTPLAVVDFYAGWCGPCIMFKPKFARIAKDYPHVAFFMVDGEKSPNARKSVQIDNLPYFGFYKDGVLVTGASTSKEDAFRALVDTHLGAAP
ncbi:MAG: thioredoxin family protein [Alphaproteobacteria bacterium]|nr:thioredoxin family protein [Alphaproteobacteria bacterium]